MPDDMPTQDLPTHDRLIETIDVPISAFALLNLSAGHRLCFSGSSGPIVHFVLTGEGVFEFPSIPALSVKAGDVVVIPPNCRKTVRTGDGPVSDTWLGDRCKMNLAGLVQIDTGPKPFDLQLLCGSVGAGVLGSYGLFDKLALPIQDGLRDIAFAGAAFAQLRSELEVPAFATYAVAGALMKACFALVIRRHLDNLLELHGFERGYGHENLRRALSHVLDRPALPHSVASLSEVAGMSRTSFTRTFTAAVGISPMAFVMKVRLHHAANLLITTNLSVKAIAASTGLSRSHFSRAFHTTYGRNPISFRMRIDGR